MLGWPKQKWRTYYKDTESSSVRMQLDLRKRLETGTGNCHDPPMSASLLLSAVLICSVAVACLFVIVRPHKEKNMQSPRGNLRKFQQYAELIWLLWIPFPGLDSGLGNLVQLGSSLYLCPLNCGKEVLNDAIAAGRAPRYVGMHSAK